MPRARFPTSLGDVIAEWIEDNCCHGPGDVYGQPVRLTAEECNFLEAAYAIDPVTGRRVNDIAVYSRRKGTRKSELGAWICHVEAVGPCRAVLDVDGDAAITTVTDPWVLCAATTEDQSDLVYGAFRAIAKASDTLAPLYDVGLEVTHLRDRPGKVELTQTRNAAALDGARPTCEVCDEPHLWTGNLHESFATLRRNLRKRKQSQPWLFAATTAYQPGQDSEAERLHLAAQKNAPRLIFDHRQAPGHYDLEVDEERRAAIVDAGGDAHWSDVDSIDAEYHASWPDVAQWRRYWLNQPTATDEQWCPPDLFDSVATDDDAIADGEAVSLGFDGSLYDDATVLWASRMSDGLLVPLGIWERPDDAPRAWAMPKGEIDDFVEAEMARLSVVRFYADPHYWQSEVEAWARNAPRRAVVVPWDTRRTTAMAAALERLRTDMGNAALRVSSDTRGRRHFLNAAAEERRGQVIVVKPSPRLKVDSVYGAALAHEARADAITAGWKPKKRTTHSFR